MMEHWNSEHEPLVPQLFQLFQTRVAERSQDWNPHIIIMEEVFTMERNKIAVDPLFLTPEQAARRSGIGVNTIRRLMESGELGHITIGNRKLTSLWDLREFYERSKTPVS